MKNVSFVASTQESDRLMCVCRTLYVAVFTELWSCSSVLSQQVRRRHVFVLFCMLIGSVGRMRMVLSSVGSS